MKNETSILARSAPLLAAYARKPVRGSFAPDFEAMDTKGRTIRLFDDVHAGRPILLVFCGRLDRPDVAEAMQAWADFARRSAEYRVQLIAVTEQADAAGVDAVERQLGGTATVLADGSGAIFARYGLVRGRDLQSPDVAHGFLITPNGQIAMEKTDMPDSTPSMPDTLTTIANEQAETAKSGWIPGHAPILVIPKVLSTDMCERLIDHFEGSDGFRVNKPGPQESEAYKFAASDYNRQDRIDHVIRDAALTAELDTCINERVIPQIGKAFAFPVTRRESLHIARYSGAREGIAIGHRDNVHPSTQYRRFALSISLNTDYEGGELVFREYAGKGYRGETGTAFVFSSSLLHEVEETTSGTRYNLISHFFNDAAVAPRG